MPKIAIIGCGVIGLTTAVQLQKDIDNAEITIFTEKVSPNTTGDVSAGLWTPYLLGETPLENVIKWSKLTHDYFHELWKNGHAQDAGICLQPITKLFVDFKSDRVSGWLDIPFGAHKLTDRQLEVYNRNKKIKYNGGIHFVSFTCEPTKLLPFLTKQFTDNGGKIVQKKIHALTELSDFHVIVNCTGLESRNLAGDAETKAIRGQIARVKAPWQFDVLSEEDNTECYIIPNSRDVILGGTHQYNNYSLEVSETDKLNILSACFNVSPGLQASTECRDMVGLRPGRGQVRLEAAQLNYKDRKINIVHNYGHGGSGVTLCIGCAKDASKLIQDFLVTKGLKASL